jgi:hypothetical protein
MQLNLIRYSESGVGGGGGRAGVDGRSRLRFFPSRRKLDVTDSFFNVVNFFLKWKFCVSHFSCDWIHSMAGE